MRVFLCLISPPQTKTTVSNNQQTNKLTKHVVAGDGAALDLVRPAGKVAKVVGAERDVGGLGHRQRLAFKIGVLCFCLLCVCIGGGGVSKVVRDRASSTRNTTNKTNSQLTIVERLERGKLVEVGLDQLGDLDEDLFGFFCFWRVV